MTNTTKTTWKQKLLMVFVSVSLTLGILGVAGHFIKIDGDRLNKKLVLKAWFLKNTWLGPPQIGIFQTDPQYGWRHKPLSEGRHFEPYGFDVKYNIDGQGNRLSPGNELLPEILFLGGSYTFGHGVENDETYVSLLAGNFPEFKMANAAVMGWGTIQSWMRLKEELAKNEHIKLVVYGFIGHHQQRNYLRRDWLQMLDQWGRQNPHVEILQGKIDILGLADPHVGTMEKGDLLDAKEKEITLQLLTEMRDNCEERGIPFLVAYLPDDGNLDFGLDILTVIPPQRFIDLRQTIDFHKVKNDVDGHLSPKGYAETAHNLEPFLRKALNKKDEL